MAAVNDRTTTIKQLQDIYGIKLSNARRVLEIAKEIGPNSEPCEDGYVLVTYRNGFYSVEDHTKKTPRKVAHSSGRDYNQVRPRSQRRNDMPPKGRKPAPASEPEADEAVDFTRYLEKDLTPTMQDFVEWFGQEVADPASLDPDRLLVAGIYVYSHFQKSDFNKDRKAERRAARQAEVPEDEEEETAPPPKSRGKAGRKPAAAGKAAAKPTPARTRGRRAAAVTAPY